MSSKFKLDENLPRDAAALLISAGYDTDTVLDENLGGKPDDEVIEAARKENRILVTLDLDFADVRGYPPSQHPGIWVLRGHTLALPYVISLLRGAIEVLKTESPAGKLWIVEAGRVRIHE